MCVRSSEEQFVDTSAIGMDTRIRLRPAKAGKVEQRFFGRVTSASLDHGRPVTEILREHVASCPEDYIGFLTELGAIDAETGRQMRSGRANS